ncbi:oxidoreductase [Candidatus Saccharibacteria bacterium]|nr:oxidoreductase [Candidatus Saccharibacteria bacterium]
MIIFFGPAGAGKSIQGQMLSARHGWRWLSTGQMFRDSKDPEIHRILGTGDLISDELTYEVVDESIRKSADFKHLIIDGFPRTKPQAEWLLGYLESNNRTIDIVVVLEVPESEIQRRLSVRGRMEDTPEIISKRMNIYRKEMYPVLSYFAENAVKIVHLDGTGSVGEVHDRIQAELETCQLD